MTGHDEHPDLTTRDDIEALVSEFYRAAAIDGLLGPVFDAASIDSPHHIDRITDFWTWQLLGGERYGRNPLLAHRPVHDRTPFTDEHFQRWLELFVATVDRCFAGPVAETAKGRATKMATALERLLAGKSDAGAAPTQVACSATPSAAEC